MNQLSIDSINSNSPYEVFLSERFRGYLFVTNYEVQYSIDFIEDDLLTQSESYQFIIQNINNSSSPRDPFVRETIMRIVEEFFQKNQSTLLYICDSSDGKQSMRSRLFNYWFEGYNEKDKYEILSSNVVDAEGTPTYVSVIFRKDNPDAEIIKDEFTQTTLLLSTKPE